MIISSWADPASGNIVCLDSCESDKLQHMWKESELKRQDGLAWLPEEETGFAAMSPTNRAYIQQQRQKVEGERDKELE